MATSETQDHLRDLDHTANELEELAFDHMARGEAIEARKLGALHSQAAATQALCRRVEMLRITIHQAAENVATLLDELNSHVDNARADLRNPK